MKQQLLLAGILCWLGTSAQTLHDTLATRLLKATDKPPVVFTVDNRKGWLEMTQAGRLITTRSLPADQGNRDTAVFPRIGNWQLLPGTLFSGWSGTKKNVPKDGWAVEVALLKRTGWRVETAWTAVVWTD